MPADFSIPPDGLSPRGGQVFPPEDTARLIARARTLEEVVEDVHRAGAPMASSDDPEALQAVRAWNQAFSPGDPEAFVHRLGWDGLTPGLARWLLSDAADATGPAALPGWVQWIEQVDACSEDVAADWASGGLPDADRIEPADDLPFAELFVPMVRCARAAIDRAAPSCAELLAPPARRALERQLARELAWASALALHERFTTFLAQVGPGDDGERTPGPPADPEPYRIYVLMMLAGGWRDVWSDHPVLARQIATLVARHVEAVAELTARLVADLPVLGDAFGQGTALGPVVALDPALSDPHDGRRRVMALTFASGVRLIYKPRDVRVEAAFSDLLRWLAGRGLEPAPRALQVIVRDGYGWVEYAQHEALERRSDVERYYRQAGALMCITHLLRARDLHMENVIATARGPVLVDLEMLFEPVGAGVLAAGEDALPVTGLEADAVDSCLGTGLLSCVETAPDGSLFEVGGLRGEGRGVATVPRRAWTTLGTSALAPREEATFAVAVRNAVMVDGQRQAPESHARALIDGFTQAWQVMASHREALLAATGPLAAFRGARTRVLVRGTNQYGMLLQVLAAPRYQRHGPRRSGAFDVLARAFAASGRRDRPRAWPIYLAERRSLERLDVPRFTVPADGVDVMSADDVVLERGFVRSGFEAALDRIRRMAPRDLERHRTAIARALDERADTTYRAPLPAMASGSPTDAAGTDPAVLAAHAAWIAEELLARAGAGPDGALTWTARVDRQGADGGVPSFFLHDGSLGASLCLAAVAAVTREPRWREAALASLAPLARLLSDPDADIADDVPVGATAGLGSLVYALTVVSRLLEDPASLRLAGHAARLITPARIERDHLLDVVGGAAGAVLALLALHEVTREEDVLARARLCGDRLVAAELPREQAGLWRTVGGTCYLGFAHGVAGIATALARLARRTSDDRYRAAAARAYARLHAAFLPTRANWPILVSPHAADPRASRTMTAWCHGAPGIVLAFLSAPESLRQPAWTPMIEAALNRVATAGPHLAEHVCCGNLSRAESLLAASRHLYSSAAGAAAGRVVASVVTRARRRGHVRLSAVPHAYRIFDVGFLQGLSGVGYSLARHADPARVPSVVSFDVM